MKNWKFSHTSRVHYSFALRSRTDDTFKANFQNMYGNKDEKHADKLKIKWKKRASSLQAMFALKLELSLAIILNLVSGAFLL
jgi:predicted component of type VI protein secretion system